MVKDPKKKNHHSHLALFAGMGGFIAASNRVGFKTVFANEIEGSCLNVLRESFPNLTISAEDITIVKTISQICRVALMFSVRGFLPVLSQAGSNKGADDERGKLFFEITRFVKMLEAPPKILLLENVPFLALYNKGERLSLILNHLRKAGYWVSKTNSLILNSRDVTGSPQSRERLFIIACHSKYFRRNPFGAQAFPEKEHSDLWGIIDKRERKSDEVYLPAGKYYLMISQSISSIHLTFYVTQRSFVRPCPQEFAQL